MHGDADAGNLSATAASSENRQADTNLISRALSMTQRRQGSQNRRKYLAAAVARRNDALKRSHGLADQPSILIGERRNGRK